MPEIVKTSEFSYKQKIDAAIRDLLLEFECQPILFIGSGISRRYFAAPNWMELLSSLFSYIPDRVMEFEYFRQKFDSDPIKIGTAVSEAIFEWAWSSQPEEFPAAYFSNEGNKDIFLKHLCCKHITEQTPELSNLDSQYIVEIEALSAIRPHAIITTNYDLFLEKVFDGYETITGQTILRYNTNSFGEIFHIHGDVSDSNSLVLTQRDYDEWQEKKKYVSAKLLTYFAEHPVFIFGYSIGDPNVKFILRDIGEIVADENGVIPNVYQVIWQSNPIPNHPSENTTFSVEGREYQIKVIYTNELKWIFDALKGTSTLNSVNLKLVRALAARTMKLIREDIPSGSVVVDYDILERVAEDGTELPKLLGIASVTSPNQSHPLTITQVATRLGFKSWHRANKLVIRIKTEKGIDLRSSDNAYHCKIRTGTGKNSITRKWSHAAVDLLNKVHNNLNYEVNL